MFYTNGAFYYIYLFSSLAIVVPLIIWLSIKNKKETLTNKLKPIKYIWITLIILEVLKIWWLIYELGSLPPNRFPLVFCSIILYTCPLFCFKETKLSEAARGLSIIPAMIATMAFLILPGDIRLQFPHTFTTYILAAHSFLFHTIMMGIAIYMIVVKIYVFKRNNYIPAFLAYATYIGIATGLSLLIGADISIFGPDSPNLGIIYDIAGYLPGQIALLGSLFFIYMLIHFLVTIKDNQKITLVN